MRPQPIADGVRLHTIPTPKFKTITLCVLLRRSLRREEVTANALLANILSRGCAKYPGLTQLNAALEGLYGSVFDCQVVKKGEEQLLQFYFETLRQSADSQDEALDFLEEVIFRPLTQNGGFLPEIVAGETVNLRNQIESRMNNKSEYAKLRLLAQLYPRDPFGLYADGYAEDLPGLEPAGLLDHYRRLLSSSPIEIVVIGDVEEERLAGCLSRCPWGARDVRLPSRADYAIHSSEVTRGGEELGGAQAKLVMGFRAGTDPVSPDFYGLLLANEIIGGGASSLLFDQAREKESLCYTINSTVYRFKSLLVIQAGIDGGKAARVEELAGRVIGQIAQGELEEGVLQAAKKSLVKKFIGTQDYPAACLDFYASQYLLGDTVTLEELVRRIEALNVEDVRKAARRLQLGGVFLLT